MANATWNLVDLARVDAAHANLPTKERRAFYEKITKRFKINSDGTIEGDITDNKFATKQYPITKWQELGVFLFFNFFASSYFVPAIILISLTFYFYVSQSWISLMIMIVIILLFEFAPVSLWREYYQNTFYFLQYNYFSYRFVYHSSTKDYISKQLTGDKNYKGLTICGVPHAIFPVGIQLMPPVAKDVLNKPILGAMADILYYIPVIRQLFMWTGVISASKKWVVKALKNDFNVGLVAGMYNVSCT